MKAIEKAVQNWTRQEDKHPINTKELAKYMGDGKGWVVKINNGEWVSITSEINIIPKVEKNKYYTWWNCDKGYQVWLYFLPISSCDFILNHKITIAISPLNNVYLVKDNSFVVKLEGNALQRYLSLMEDEKQCGFKDLFATIDNTHDLAKAMIKVESVNFFSTGEIRLIKGNLINARIIVAELAGYEIVIRNKLPEKK
ncbi:MAG: hypothetical protein WDA06_09560 [Phenylobacterium sp.]